MAQVDQALRRAAYDIGYKDELIGVLEAEVTALREGRTEDADVLRQAREAASRPTAAATLPPPSAGGRRAQPSRSRRRAGDGRDRARAGARRPAADDRRPTPTADRPGGPTPAAPHAEPATIDPSRSRRDAGRHAEQARPAVRPSA